MIDWIALLDLIDSILPGLFCTMLRVDLESFRTHYPHQLGVRKTSR